jgi:hypothetical protein
MALPDPLLEVLLGLGLEVGDHVVFGSAPLFVHGLKDSLRDVDVVARGRAWRQVEELGRQGVLIGPEPPPSGRGRVFRHREVPIEIFDEWTTPFVDVDDLIASAELVGGIPFVPVGAVLAWKAMSNREKDRLDYEAVTGRTSHPG